MPWLPTGRCKTPTGIRRLSDSKGELQGKGVTERGAGKCLGGHAGSCANLPRRLARGRASFGYLLVLPCLALVVWFVACGTNTCWKTLSKSTTYRRISWHTNPYWNCYQFGIRICNGACLSESGLRWSLRWRASLSESDPKTCLIGTRWIQKIHLHLVAVLSSGRTQVLLAKMELERVGFKTYYCTHCSSSLKFWT